MRKFEKNIENRKVLVARLSELTGLESRYTFVPRCAYVVGSFTVEKDGSLTVEDGADEQVLSTLITEGLIGTERTEEEPDTQVQETAGPEQAEEQDTAAENQLDASISFPLSRCTPSSVINLVCMIHSRGPLLSKATGGEFYASKELADELLGHTVFVRTQDVVDFLNEHENLTSELRGISFGEDKLTFNGFGTALDPEHVQTFMKLAAAMNKMAIMQKRVQAKNVDDSNEKYALRIWLIRLGLNGNEFKADRKRLMANLTGHTAFRSEEEKDRWTAKQAAKRDALKAAKEAGQPAANAV